MYVDTNSMISITEVSKNASKVVNSVAEDGRVVTVMKSNQPACLIVPMETAERLDRLDELEEDLRLLALALTRVLTDSGARHDLNDVMAELGISDDAAEPDR